MRVSREQAEQNRKNVLMTAARLFRQHGIDGIGVADVMNAAGLTHGGFYGQFDSKEDLALQAVAEALRQSAEAWDLLSDGEKDVWLAIKESYLSLAHCNHPEAGCALTALAVEGPRRGASLQAVLTRGVQVLLAKLESVLPRKRGQTPRAQAMLALSTMVGAVVLARAFDDEALAREILDVAKRGI